MEWTDEALVLGAARHGESALVVELLTRHHGRHKGLMRGGAGSRMRGVAQAGNRVAAIWRGRLAEHLGTATLELVDANAAAVLGDPARLLALGALCAVASAALPEREPHPEVFEAALAVIGLLRDDDADPVEAAAALVYWELGLLGALGYGLDLDSCAVTGGTEALAYVSPKSGRAVSREGAGDYADRLLPLPRFLREKAAPAAGDVLAGFELTGHFLDRSVLVPNRVRLPAARGRLLDLLRRTSSGSE
ncbi:MAG: DNA repair protein RecO [Alphaproteobacteria bacterium]|nr:DNA repair protein RecO [Alphaproteobacteria bacterium]